MRNIKKKVMIASFFAILMLMLPFSAVAGQDDVLDSLETYNKLEAEVSASSIENRLNELYNKIEEIKDEELRELMQTIVNEMLECDLDSSMLELETLLVEMGGSMGVSGSQQVPVPPNGGDPPQNLWDLIVWILEAIVEYLRTGVNALIWEIFYAFVDLRNGVKDIFNGIGNILDNITDPAPWVELGAFALACFLALLYLIANRPKIPRMIKDGIRSMVIGSMLLAFQMLYQFSEPRLGYVGDFIPYTLNTLGSYQNLSGTIENKIDRMIAIFIELPKACYDFIFARNLVDRWAKLGDLDDAIDEAQESALEWLEDIRNGEPEIINGVLHLLENLTWMEDYFNAEPWEDPIHINGTIDGASGMMTVSCDGDSCITNGDGGYYSINYSTEGHLTPCWWFHTIIVRVTGSKTGVAQLRAFSKGEIYLAWDFSSDNDGDSDGEVLLGQTMGQSMQMQQGMRQGML